MSEQESEAPSSQDPENNRLDAPSAPSTPDAQPAAAPATLAADDGPGFEFVAAPKREPAKWGEPLAKADAFWSKFELWLCVTVVVLQIAALTAWAALRGLSTGGTSESNAGIVFRALSGALVFGLAGHYLAQRKRAPAHLAIAGAAAALVPAFLVWFVWVRRGERIGGAGILCVAFLGLALFRLLRSPDVARATHWGGPAGIAIGLVLARAWSNLFVEWSSNLLNWYQQASTLTLLGGLRGVGTRLTMLVALLGGSLATASGRHIAVDIVTRFVKPKVRLPMTLAGWIGASAICFAASWGFFDHVSIEDFGAKADSAPAEKFKAVGDGLEEKFFILRKQIALDFKSFPHIMNGESYADWLTGAEWNAWVMQAGFVERYGPEKTEALKISDDSIRSPIVVIPDVGEPRGELIDAANLVWAIGLFIISIRFLVLCVLALSGHRSIDPEPEGSEIQRRHDDPNAALEGKV
jgi:hypothetical protein